MAFNADDIWEFPAAAVVAAKAAVQIGPNHAAPAEVNPGAVLGLDSILNNKLPIRIHKYLRNK
jgi:hypothetical protein